MMAEKEIAENVDKESRKFISFRLGDEEFGADVMQIKEISKMKETTRVPTAPSYVEGVMNLRGTITPIINLWDRLDLDQESPEEEGRIVIAEHEDHFTGMIVDEVVDVIEILEEDIDSAPDLVTTDISHEFIEGVGKIEENRLVIILDLEKVFAKEEMDEVGDMRSEDVSESSE